MNNNLLEAGKIVNTHGLRGEIMIYPLCDGADFLLDLERFFIDGRQMTVRESRVHKNQLLCRLDSVDSIEKAQALVGKKIFIDRADVELEEGRYFIEDIKGMTVRHTETGKEYGIVSNVIQTGANDVFEIRQGDKTLLIPKIDDVVKKIDLAEGVVEILPMKGLFDE